MIRFLRLIKGVVFWGVFISIIFLFLWAYHKYQIFQKKPPAPVPHEEKERVVVMLKDALTKLQNLLVRLKNNEQVQKIGEELKKSIEKMIALVQQGWEKIDKEKLKEFSKFSEEKIKQLVSYLKEEKDKTEVNEIRDKLKEAINIASQRIEEIEGEVKSKIAMAKKEEKPTSSLKPKMIVNHTGYEEYIDKKIKGTFLWKNIDEKKATIKIENAEIKVPRYRLENRELPLEAAAFFHLCLAIPEKDRLYRYGKVAVIFGEDLPKVIRLRDSELREIVRIFTAKEFADVVRKRRSNRVIRAEEIIVNNVPIYSIISQRVRDLYSWDSSGGEALFVPLDLEKKIIYKQYKAISSLGLSPEDVELTYFHIEKIQGGWVWRLTGLKTFSEDKIISVEDPVWEGYIKDFEKTKGRRQS